jgi:hypothetical protein
MADIFLPRASSSTSILPVLGARRIDRITPAAVQ